MEAFRALLNGLSVKLERWLLSRYRVTPTPDGKPTGMRLRFTTQASGPPDKEPQHLPVPIFDPFTTLPPELILIIISHLPAHEDIWNFARATPWLEEVGVTHYLLYVELLSRTKKIANGLT